MPRTEKDLDRLMSEIEKHKAFSHALGSALNDGDLDEKEVLIRAAKADESLYNLCDQIQEERSDEREDDIAQESSAAS
jgi:hypothetical protein